MKKTSIIQDDIQENKQKKKTKKQPKTDKNIQYCMNL